MERTIGSLRRGPYCELAVLRFDFGHGLSANFLGLVAVAEADKRKGRGCFLGLFRTST